MTVDYVCLNCKNPFRAKKRVGRKYCSYECGKSGITGRTNNGKHIPCEICSKLVYRSKLRLHIRCFCSVSCRTKGLRGVGASNWQGGHKLYYGPNWQEIRKEIRIKYDYTCQECGRIKKELGQHPDAHHKIPLKTYKGDYEKANQHSNLTLMCRACHQRSERNFDKIKTSKLEIVEISDRSASRASRSSVEEVREIRRLFASGNYSQREIGERYMLCQSTVSKIVLGQTWKHV